jgi:hypothetical protein
MVFKATLRKCSGFTTAADVFCLNSALKSGVELTARHKSP